MKYLLIASALFLAPIVSFAEGDVARDCQIFVDKLEASYGSHGSCTVKAYVKIIRQALDGDIKEVGIRGVSAYGRNDSNRDIDQPLYKMADDYYVYSLMVSSDFGGGTVKGAFYVKTDKGTVYWANLNNEPGANFSFDIELYRQVRGLRSYEYAASADTRNPEFAKYNARRCY